MMILKEHNISVRLPQERAVDTGITFVQNDKGVYKLNVRVFDGDAEINYSQVSSATITFSKADGTVVQGDMQKATNMLTYYLGTNEIAAPGKLLASIQLLGANERLTTARFLFRVEKDLITEDAVKSTSEFPILQQLKQELEDIDVVELTNQFNAHKAERTPHIFTGAKVRGSVSQSIPNATTTTLELPITVFDTNEMISSSKIYAKVAGYYLITATVVFESNANGYRELVIRKNADNTLLTARRVRAVDSATTAIGASIIVYLNANEYITLAVAQNSGTALNTIASTFTPELSVVKVG